MLFLGSIPLLREEGKNTSLYWRWKLEDREIKTASKNEAEKIAELLVKTSHSKGLNTAEFHAALEELTGEKQALRIFKKLRESGLVVF
jgi:hypothetical protein